MTRELTFQAKRYRGTVGKCHFIKLSSYDALQRVSIYIPISLTDSVEFNDGVVTLRVKSWWLDKNPEMLGGWRLNEIINNCPTYGTQNKTK